MLSQAARVTVYIHHLHFLRLCSHGEEEVKMTSCLPHRKWNFFTFRYTFPKEKWSNVIFRAATFNISTSLNSQLPPSVSALTHTRKEAWLTLHVHSSCQAGGNLPFLLRRNNWARVSCSFPQAQVWTHLRSIRKYLLPSGRMNIFFLGVFPFRGWDGGSSFQQWLETTLSITASTLFSPTAGLKPSWVGEVEETEKENISTVSDLMSVCH